MRHFIHRLVAVLQIAGGFWGMVSLGGRVLEMPTPVGLLAMLLGTMAFAVALVAGVMLIAGQARAVHISMWVQLAQIPIVASPLFSYGWHVGAVAAFGLRLGGGWSFGYAVPSMAWQWALHGPDGVFLGINFIAIVAFLLLFLTRR